MKKSVRLIFGVFIIVFCVQLTKADSISTSFSKKNDDTIILQPDSSKVIRVIVRTFETGGDKSKDKEYITIILPILTLLIGFFLNRGYDSFSKRKTIEKEGNRWIGELRCLDNPLENQISSIEEFLKSHNEDKFKTPELKIEDLLNCEIFKSLDKSNFLKYLQTKNKDFSKAVLLSNRTHGSISALTFVYTNLIKHFNNYVDETSKHVGIFNEHLSSLMKSFAEYSVVIEKRTGKSPQNDTIYNQIWDLFSKHVFPHLEDGEIELFNFQKQFISPLAEIVSTNRLNDDLKDIAEYSSKCNREIKAIKMEKRYLKENFTNTIEFLKKSKEKLDELIKKIQ